MGIAGECRASQRPAFFIPIAKATRARPASRICINFLIKERVLTVETVVGDALFSTRPRGIRQFVRLRNVRYKIARNASVVVQYDKVAQSRQANANSPILHLGAVDVGVRECVRSPLRHLQSPRRRRTLCPSHCGVSPRRGSRFFLRRSPPASRAPTAQTRPARIGGTALPAGDRTRAAARRRLFRARQDICAPAPQRRSRSRV